MKTDGDKRQRSVGGPAGLCTHWRSLNELFAKCGLKNPFSYSTTKRDVTCGNCLRTNTPRECKPREIRDHPTVVRPNQPNLTVVFPDVHFPIQDQRSLDACYSLVQDLKPDHIVQLGDIVEFYHLSKHHHEAGKTDSLWDEALSCKSFWEEIQSHGRRVDYLPGNHEFRFKRFIDENTFLFGHPAFRLESVLGIPKGINVHPWKTKLRLGSLCIEHGDDLPAGGNNPAVRVYAKRPTETTVFGHCHRISSYRYTTYERGEPRTRGAFSLGHLSDIKKHTWIAEPNWQQGLGVIEWWGRGKCTLYVLELFDHKIKFNGKTYQ